MIDNGSADIDAVNQMLLGGPEAPPTLNGSRHRVTEAPVKCPPHDLDAEQGVIGAVLLKPDVLPQVLGIVQPVQFYDPQHQIIFRAMADLAREDIPADLTTVVARLRSTNTYEQAGGALKVKGCLENCPTAAHATHYAAIVTEKASLRRLACMVSELNHGIEAGKPALRLVEHAEQSLCSIKDNRESHGPTYRRINCAELDQAEYQTEYLIERTLVAGQPCIMAGGKKMLKTTIAVDMFLSVALAQPFLGMLAVPRAARVLFMSGESGLETLQETARRIASAKGFNLSDIDGMLWSPDLPKFGDVAHMLKLPEVLKGDEIEVLGIDPAYLSMPGGDAGNLFIQGEMLRAMNEVCQSCGTTLVLIHHAKKGIIDPFAPPELEDIAWSGFQEFARQWLLVGRRERYEPGSGSHRLWMNCGGSAGHSALRALDINEGEYDGRTPRRWEVEVSKAEEARQAAKDAQDDAKAAKADEKLERNKKSILTALAKLPDHRGTMTDIRDRSGFSGRSFSTPFAELLNAGHIKPDGTIKKSNRREYEAYKLGIETNE